MITTEAIDNALAAHVNWKKRLHEALITGKSDYKVQDVKNGEICPFGMWLCSLPDEEKGSPEYSNILKLHAQFHNAAGEILEMILIGKKDEALKDLEFGGRFGLVSGRLVLALQKWRNDLTI